MNLYSIIGLLWAVEVVIIELMSNEIAPHKITFKNKVLELVVVKKNMMESYTDILTELKVKRIQIGGYEISPGMFVMDDSNTITTLDQNDIPKYGLYCVKWQSFNEAVNPGLDSAKVKEEVREEEKEEGEI